MLNGLKINNNNNNVPYQHVQNGHTGWVGSFGEDIRTRINRNGLRINISSHKLAFIAARVRKSPT